MLELEEDESSVSQLLIEAALVGEEATVNDALAHKLVDVNYRGTVSLRVKYSDTVQQEEAPDQVKIEYEEFKTDVTPLFAAAHAGHINITRKLLVISFSAPKMENLLIGCRNTQTLFFFSLLMKRIPADMLYAILSSSALVMRFVSFQGFCSRSLKSHYLREPKFSGMFEILDL